jgi:hypothetical protein
MSDNAIGLHSFIAPPTVIVVSRQIASDFIKRTPIKNLSISEQIRYNKNKLTIKNSKQEETETRGRNEKQY